jgi:sulfur-oxidizing protein SoxY
MIAFRSTALRFAAGIALALSPLLAAADAWDELRPSLWPDRAIADGAGFMRLAAPERAFDAAVTPVEIAVTPPEGRSVARLTLIVDENPAPVAAEFEIGPAMGREVRLSTRVRVDAYSEVRAIAELDDGSLHMAHRFVKASGGCSAPASKDAAAATAALGQLRLRVFDAPDRPEAQTMVRHPNHSGFQVDQVTLLTVPPHFVDAMEVRLGGDLVFRMSGGISLSEDPAIRFGYAPNGAEAFEVRATDTEGGEFHAAFPARPSV